jgi:soluble lytic murein transglycosylase-like protein
MRRPLQLALAGLAIALPLHAAELATLRNGFSIRHQRHETAGETTRLYMSAAPDSGYIDVPTAEIDGFEPAPQDPQERAVRKDNPPDLKSIVSNASLRNQVDADFIASVIRAESANNPDAVSPKGAQGLMQLMPQTANMLGVKNSFDPAENVDGGVRYLRALLLLYDNDMIKALAAYNAGPERVQQYKGLPPYRETHAYVARVIKDYNRTKLAKRKTPPSAAHHRKPAVPSLVAQSGDGSVAARDPAR